MFDKGRERVGPERKKGTADDKMNIEINIFIEGTLLGKGAIRRNEEQT